MGLQLVKADGSLADAPSAMSFGALAASKPAMRAIFLGLLVCVLGWSLPAARAQAKPETGKPAHDARSERLSGLTRSDLARLQTQLADGPVALIEFANTDADQLPAIHIASHVEATPRALLEVVRNPDEYPRFMRTLDHVDVVGHSGNTIVYDWRWQMAVLTFEGRNTMTVFEPPVGRPGDGYRVTIDSQNGDLGVGRMSIRILPRGERASTLVISMRIDLRQANYVARQLAAAARSVNRSANIALTYSMLLGFKHRVEREAAPSAAQAPVMGDANAHAFALIQPKTNVRELLPLLLRGDLVFLDMQGRDLRQLAVLGLVHQRSTLVREVMLDAASFGGALLPGAAARVVERDGPATTFDWEIDLPLIGVGGRMRMTDRGTIEVDAIAGSLEGGQWRFELTPLGRNSTLVTSWARFDLADAAWLVRQLANADRNLGHGMTAASEVMLLRALRSRSQKHAEELAKNANKAKR